jgi:hypothetical protein
MADEKNTVKTDGADDRPKDEKNLAADVSDIPTDPAVKTDGADLKTGVADKTADPAAVKDGADLPPPGDVRVTSKVVDGLFDGKKKAARDAEKKAAEQGGEGEPAAKKLGGRPKADKGEKADKSTKGGADDKGEKPKQIREARPTDGIKKEKAVTIGGVGASVTSPEPPKDATRPGMRRS